jgi:hypothetical protein
MTNDMEIAEKLLNKMDYKTLNILGILRNVSTGLRKLHPTFGGFGLFNLPTEQLISRVNMLFQHYHVSTNLSRKLDASLRYLQLQIGSPRNPLELDFSKWGYLATPSWVKLLWKLLHAYNIQLHMLYPEIPNPRGQDHAIMDIILSQVSDPSIITKLNRCRGSRKAIFLSDLVTADGKYLEHFVSYPESAPPASKYTFPREVPTKDDWTVWANFWRGYTNTGGKLKTPLGNWKKSTHRIWQWFYDKSDDDLQHLSEGRIIHFKPVRSFMGTRSTTFINKPGMKNKLTTQ